MADDKFIFTRPRAEIRGASNAYLPVLARVEIDGTTKSFQVLQLSSIQHGRMHIDCALDGSLHVLGLGGGVGEFVLSCVDGPIIDCDVRENAGTIGGALSWLNPLEAAGRLLKRAGKAIMKYWTTNISDDPYKSESPLAYYVSDMDSMKKRYAKIYIYSKFESWNASDTSDTTPATMLDANKQGVTGVFHGIIKDIRVDAPGHTATGDTVITTLILVGTWTAE
jgi:hypothetical protein